MEIADILKKLEDEKFRDCDKLTNDELKFITDFMEKHHKIPSFFDVIEITKTKVIERASQFIRDTHNAAGMGSMDSRIKYFKQQMKEV